MFNFIPKNPEWYHIQGGMLGQDYEDDTRGVEERKAGETNPQPLQRGPVVELTDDTDLDDITRAVEEYRRNQAEQKQVNQEPGLPTFYFKRWDETGLQTFLGGIQAMDMAILTVDTMRSEYFKIANVLYRDHIKFLVENLIELINYGAEYGSRYPEKIKTLNKMWEDSEESKLLGLFEDNIYKRCSFALDNTIKQDYDYDKFKLLCHTFFPTKLTIENTICKKISKLKYNPVNEEYNNFQQTLMTYFVLITVIIYFEFFGKYKYTPELLKHYEKDKFIILRKKLPELAKELSQFKDYMYHYAEFTEMYKVLIEIVKKEIDKITEDDIKKIVAFKKILCGDPPNQRIFNDFLQQQINFEKEKEIVIKKKKAEQKAIIDAQVAKDLAKLKAIQDQQAKELADKFLADLEKETPASKKNTAKNTGQIPAKKGKKKQNIIVLDTKEPTEPTEKAELNKQISKYEIGVQQSTERTEPTKTAEQIKKDRIDEINTSFPKLRITTGRLNEIISRDDYTLDLIQDYIDKEMPLYTKQKYITNTKDFYDFEAIKNRVNQKQEGVKAIGFETVMLNLLNLKGIYKLGTDDKYVSEEIFYPDDTNDYYYKKCTDKAVNKGSLMGNIYDLECEKIFIECKYYLSSDIDNVSVDKNKIVGSQYYQPRYNSSREVNLYYKATPTSSWTEYDKIYRKVIFILAVGKDIYYYDLSSDSNFIEKVNNDGTITIKPKRLKGTKFIIPKHLLKKIFLRNIAGSGIHGGALLDDSAVNYGKDTSTDKLKASSDFNKQLKSHLDSAGEAPTLKSGSKADREKYRQDMAKYNAKVKEKEKEFHKSYKDEISGNVEKQFTSAGYTKDKSGKWRKPASLEDVPLFNDTLGKIPGFKNFANKAISAGEKVYEKPNLENIFNAGKTLVDSAKTGYTLASKLADPKKLIKDVAISQGKKVLGMGIKGKEEIRLYKDDKLLLSCDLLKNLKDMIKEKIEKPIKSHPVYTVQNGKIKKYMITPNLTLKKIT